MEITEALDRQGWEDALPQQPESSFLQSYDWGEFQSAAGHRARRFVIRGHEMTRIQAFEHPLPFGGSYLYIPHADLTASALKALADYVTNEGYSFIRAEPRRYSGSLEPLKTQPTRHRQPAATLVLDLGQSSEKLLSAMHAKTRYNIHLAERKGVSISTEKSSAVFLSLMQETADRDEFKIHPPGYYEAMLKLPSVHQGTAYYENRPIASNLYVAYGDTYTYLHGASANAARSVMAPYLLQWHAIATAQSDGYRVYDFWGIAPLAAPDEPSTSFHGLTWRAEHPWTGITRFKAGFGGTVLCYPPAFEMPLNQLSYLIFKTARKIWR